jgi:hypothetical protein
MSSDPSDSEGKARRTRGRKAPKSEAAEPRFVDVREQKRLNEAREAGIPWKKWGPYLSERSARGTADEAANSTVPEILRSTPLAAGVRS